MCSEMERLEEENRVLRESFVQISNGVMKAQEEGIITDTIWLNDITTLFEELDHTNQKFGIQTELVL